MAGLCDPCRRFANVLADGDARLGVGAGRYPFIVTDFRRLLLAGLPAHGPGYLTESRPAEIHPRLRQSATQSGPSLTVHPISGRSLVVGDARLLRPLIDGMTG